MPLQFSWAAVAAYCAHEAAPAGHSTATAGATHLGHHEHQHPQRAQAEPAADAPADADADSAGPAQADKMPGAIDVDCGQCHGHCSVMPSLPSALPGVPVAALPRTSLDETGGACTPARPERPQWRPLA